MNDTGAGKILLVSEIFGPTIQGEGPYAGRPASFVRLGKCNLTCSWCDSKYTWDSTTYNLADEIHPMSFDEICQTLAQWKPPTVIITGGEPLLQRNEIEAFIQHLRARLPVEIHIETNGTVSPTSLADLVDVFVVSPKLANSNTAQRARIRNRVLAKFAKMENAYFKFVVEGPDDLIEIDQVAERLGIPAQKIWVMPQGTNSDVVRTRIQRIADAVVTRNWSISNRLHLDIWGDERGH